MKKPSPWSLLPLLPAIWIVVQHATGSGLFADTDTRFLLLKLRERQNPISWFWTDWPLQNHFYRPVSTLFFEFDRLVYGQNANGFGLTQVLIVVVCLFLAYWMLKELTGSAAKAGLASGLLGAWTASWPVGDWLSQACWFGAVLAFAGLVNGFRKIAAICGGVVLVATAALTGGANIYSGLQYGVIAGVAAYVLIGTLEAGWKTFPYKKIPTVLALCAGLALIAQLMNPPVSLSFRMVYWLPGRTASVMTIFALISVAAYARYERLGAVVRPKKAGSEDVPATRGQATTLDMKPRPWLVVLTYIGAVLALASYEQAVMVPAILTGTAIYFWWIGRKPRWTVALSSWALLLAYWMVRKAFVPSGTSGYQAQQMRYLTSGALGSIFDFAFPGHYGFTTLGTAGEGFPLTLMTSGPWVALLLVCGNVVLWVWAWRSRERWIWLASSLMTVVSFLPMAFVKMFEHYYFWPSCFWCLTAVVSLSIGVERLMNGLGPPGRSAPPRTNPAPGSLPRP